MNGAEVELINKDKLKLLAPDVESASNRGLWSPTTSVAVYNYQSIRKRNFQQEKVGLI